MLCKAKKNPKWQLKYVELIHRLHLIEILTSVASSLPLLFMLHALKETRDILTTYPRSDSVFSKIAGEGPRKQLLETSFSEFVDGGK